MLFRDSSMMVLRAGVSKLLKSDAVMGALHREVGRYVDVLDLDCSAGGITGVVRPRGFSEEVRIVLSRAVVDDGGAWIRIEDISADREGVDALLHDLVRGRTFPLPHVARPFAGMLQKLLSTGN